MNASNMNITGKESLEMRKILSEQAIQFYECSVDFTKELESNDHIYKVRCG